MKQRLTAAAEEIFELFERTIAEYEEELCRQRKLLDAVLQPQVQLHRTGRFCLLLFILHFDLFTVTLTTDTVRQTMAVRL